MRLNRPLLLLAFWLPTVAQLRAAEPVDFRTQVAPLLAEHCLRCHSPSNRKGDISLATVDDLRDNEYLVPGDADGSYLVQLVRPAGDEPPQMPREAEPLSGEEVRLLARWVDEGARWPAGVVVREKSQADASWWSLQPLAAAAPPRPAGLPPEWDGSPVDRFVFARLAQRGLDPSPPADRRTLIRRLYFDLLGLPPTPHEVASFVDDPDPRAYPKLVDRLLASPHYGERYAQHWLDIAHYADTHGFERDRRRDNAWRYRDYVIRALNEDKAYDRFLQEQIAGDVLWPDDEQAVVATGFLAAGPWDFVGQVETKSPLLRRSARSLDLDDMATQVMTAAVAMTVNCARCHDHKLDPISQREYYQLRAVFAGVRRGDRVVSDAAVAQYERRKAEIAGRLDEIAWEIARLEGEGLNLADIVGGGNGRGTGQQRQGIDPRTAKVQTRDFGRLGNVVVNKFAPSESAFVDGVFIADGDDGKAQIPVSSTGLAIAGLPKTSGDAWDVIRNGPVASQHSTEIGGVDFSKTGHSLLGLHANAGITFDASALRRAIGAEALRFTAQLGYFGAAGDYRADAWVFVDGRRAASFRGLGRRDGLQPIELDLPPSARFLTLVSTDGGNGYSHDQIGFGDPRVKAASPQTLDDDGRLRLSELRRRQRQARAERRRLGAPPRFYGVVPDQAAPEVRVLLRGDPESPTGEPLAPAALSALPMLDPQLGGRESSEGGRREALARWITSPANPLAPRVIVNRLWHWHFGRGIVDTPSDFGFGGARPTHPLLLDYLAAELGRRDWSLKALHRMILNSMTYRQSSLAAAGDPRAEIDADNRLLWRQHPRRLEAEAIRDAVLAVSGSLNRRPGGPGFEDFQYTDAYAPIYDYVTADRPELWRRSIYRYVVRTTPNQFLTTLDCPDPANLTPKRLATTTPLQSLALYNNEFMLLQAEHFADRVRRRAGASAEHQVQEAFRQAFGRRPTAEEARLAAGLVARQGLFALCRSLLNSNEFLYVD